MHRGEHEQPETPPDVVPIHADQFDEVSFRDAPADTISHVRMVARRREMT